MSDVAPAIDFLEASHGIVASKLSRKLRRELGIEEPVDPSR